MKAVLFILFLGAGGENQNVAFGFPSLAECEANIKKVPEMIKDHNRSEDTKIVNYAASCALIKDAPSGDLKV